MAKPASRILGTGHHVPERVLSNHDLERMVDTSDQWIVERTGIRERRIAADGEHTSDMAAAAARAAIEAAGLRPEDIDLVVLGTVTPDMPLPSTAMFVARKVGIPVGVPAFDLAAACAGFVYGLTIADQFIRGGAARHVLVIGVELLSRVLDWTDRTTCVLFGDGAGAAVVGPSKDERGILATRIHGDPTLAESLCIPAGGSREPASPHSIEARRHFVKMNGRDIFKVAVRYLTQASKDVIEAAGLRSEDVDWVVPHQANTRILEGVAQRCGVPYERFYINIDRYGNTSSASIPIALDEAVRKGTIRTGQHVLMTALGGGIAWGAALVRW